MSENSETGETTDLADLELRRTAFNNAAARGGTSEEILAAAREFYAFLSGKS